MVLPLGPTGGFAVAVAIAVVWAATANLWRIGFPTTGLDERIYATAAWRYVHGIHGAPPTGYSSNFDNFEHPPLAKYLFGVAQLAAGHQSVVVDRVVAALCTVATAAVLGIWLGHVAGRWVGLGAATLVAVLPMSVPGLPFRFGRYGYLDPVAELFAVASVALAWTWFRRRGTAAWRFAIATGVCIGLAAACKETGFLGAVGPVAVGSFLIRRSWRVVAGRLVQVVAAAGASFAVFVLSYVGLGDPWSIIGFGLRSERRHADTGHRVEFAGRVSSHPPAWAFLWFAQHGIGAVVTVLCCVCVLAAVLLRRDRLVLWCVAALVAPLVFHMAIARVVLGFYWVMWMPAFLALVALGLAEFVRLTRSRRAVVRLTAGLTAAACAVVIAVASARDTYGVLTRPVPSHPSYAATVLRYSPATYLRLDDRAGFIAKNSSPGGYAGVYSGNPRRQAAGLLAGDPDRAVMFDGARQFASIANGSWMDVPDYAVTLWFRGSRPGGYLAARDNYASKVWDLAFDPSGRLRFGTFSSFGGHGQSVVSAAPFDDGRPHLAVGVKDGTSMLLYVDGRLAASASWPSYARSTTAGMDLARRGNNSGFFAGTLDEFAFFDTPLSAAEVLALYRAGLGTGQQSG